MKNSNSLFLAALVTALSMGAMLFLALSMKEAGKMKKIVALSVAAVVVIQVAAGGRKYGKHS